MNKCYKSKIRTLSFDPFNEVNVRAIFGEHVDLLVILTARTLIDRIIYFFLRQRFSTEFK